MMWLKVSEIHTIRGEIDLTKSINLGPKIQNPPKHMNDYHCYSA